MVNDYPLRIAMAGSRDLPLAKIPRIVIGQLVGASKVLLRHPKTAGRPPGPFEALVARLAGSLDIEVEWVRPEDGGREQVYLRDLDMVGRADRVVALFPSPSMDGGTGHVVEAAMTKGIAVEAWWVKEDGTTERIGEYDPLADGP